MTSIHEVFVEFNLVWSSHGLYHVQDFQITLS